MIYKQAGAADKGLPVILATCERKGPCPSGWQAVMLVPAPAQLLYRGGAEHPLGSQVEGGASVPQFPCRKEPCKF